MGWHCIAVCARAGGDKALNAVAAGRHAGIVDQPEKSDRTLNVLLEELNRQGRWDWCIHAFDGDALTLSAGCSLSKLRPMVAFGGVSYLACPTVFHHPVFRLASNDERVALATVTALDDEDLVVAVDADGSGSMDMVTYFIVATSATPAAGAA